MNKWFLRLIPILVVTLIISVSTTVVRSNATTVKGRGSVSISLQSQVAMAAALGGTNGVGEPIPNEIVPPTFGRGGLPISAVQYSETGDIVTVTMVGLPALAVRQSDIPSWASISVVEAAANDLIQRQLEIWTPLSSFPKDDPVRADPPVLLDNERIETSGRDFLVTTLGYGAIHIFSLSPLKFTTRFNGLDAGPITGEWWQ